jgi:hypothetical protein
MKRFIVLLSFVALVLAGCVTAGTQEAMDTQNRDIASLKAQLAKLNAMTVLPADLEAWKAQVKAAEVLIASNELQLKALEEQAAKERKDSALTIGSTILGGTAPIAALFMPILGAIMSAFGTALTGVKEKIAGGGQ